MILKFILQLIRQEIMPGEVTHKVNVSNVEGKGRIWRVQKADGIPYEVVVFSSASASFLSHPPVYSPASVSHVQKKPVSEQKKIVASYPVSPDLSELLPSIRI